MAVVGDIQSGLCAMGQNGRLFQWGKASFSSTDATTTIAVKMHQVDAVLLTYANANATDEQLFWDGPADTASPPYVVPSTGVITVGRTGASKTSGLSFSYLIIGQ